MKDLIECSKKACRWTGKESELKKVRNSEYKGLEVYDNVCPSCHGKTYYLLDSFVKCERVDQINELIKIIASYGRKFFSYEGDISHMAKDADGKVYFFDYYTRKRIYVAYKGEWKGFTSGGTLRNLVEIFYQYIKTGEPISVKWLAMSGYRTDGSNVWGYEPSEADKMREEALKLPCIYC